MVAAADNVECDNGVEARWNNDSWGLMVIDSKKQSKIKCTVKFIRYEEKLLDGAYPVLTPELVPVQIGAGGAVTKADVRTQWYKYENQEWANAVILANGKIADNYVGGDTIAETDIAAYFVWIPKYSYKLFNEKLGNYNETVGSVTDKGPTTAIDIKFGLNNTQDGKTDECTTPMLANKVQGASGDKGKCEVGNYMTHPAFLAFGGNGFWVGKFETGNSAITSKTNAITHNNDAEASQLLIKPNRYSWRNISIGNAYKTSLAYMTELQSHLMKNTEWGAVAYLTQSIYGKCTDKNNCEEVYINNNSSYITGFSGATASQAAVAVAASSNSSGKAYNYKSTNYSIKASTTGNYSGIYDMSGGAVEYVMGIMYQSGNKSLDYSDLDLTDAILTDPKYYDVYNYGTSDRDYSRRILGDATGEVGPFQYLGNLYYQGSMFEDDADFVASSDFLFYRGSASNMGVFSGIFAFEGNHITSESSGFRVVLSPDV